MGRILHTNAKSRRVAVLDLTLKHIYRSVMRREGYMFHEEPMHGQLPVHTKQKPSQQSILEVPGPEVLEDSSLYFPTIMAGRARYRHTISSTCNHAQMYINRRASYNMLNPGPLSYSGLGRGADAPRQDSSQGMRIRRMRPSPLTCGGTSCKTTCSTGCGVSGCVAWLFRIYMTCVC